MGVVLPFRPPVPARFGRCPNCGGATAVLNIGKSHWAYCDEHRSKWFVGCSLLARPRGEGPREWLANSQRLASFREVAPLQHFTPKADQDF